MGRKFYDGEDYISYSKIESILTSIVEACPQWTQLKEIGRSRNNSKIYSLMIGHKDDDQKNRPSIWLDGGTHAIEWVSVMSALFSASRWTEEILNNNPDYSAWFKKNNAIIVPCISPDGYEKTFQGSPYMRSVVRPRIGGDVPQGLEPGDINNDDRTFYMRWKSPLGTMVEDGEEPLLMRPRMLHDDPNKAYFLSFEGEFKNWDKTHIKGADQKFGLDLNRNFPSRWQPFSMIGQDSGDYSLSEPESNCLVKEFASYPYIGAAITNHSYSGCILTQPYSKNTPLQKNDIALMHKLAKDLVKDTNYNVFKVCPEFSYEEGREMVGVWSDTITTVFGILGYTLELWDPYKYAGLEVKNPGRNFFEPDQNLLRKLFAHFRSKHPELCHQWKKVSHPQLGEVEIGGVDYNRTLHNPPPALLKSECEKGFKIADNLRFTLARVSRKVDARHLGDNTYEVSLHLENSGYLPTSSTKLGENLRPCPKVSACINLSEDQSLLDGYQKAKKLNHLEGYASLAVGFMGHPLYPLLANQSQREKIRWLVKGKGKIRISYHLGRAGQGESTLFLD